MLRAGSLRAHPPRLVRVYRTSRLVCEQDREDRYGRTLAYVYRIRNELTSYGSMLSWCRRLRHGHDL